MALNHKMLCTVMAVAVLSSSPVWASDSVLEVYQQGNISYITGGIGQDESDALKAAEKDYNLRILNTDRTGHYSGDTRVVISDTKKNTLLDATSGPIFYANLPKGRYIVEGFDEGLSKKQTVVITGAKSSRVHFVWPQDVEESINY